MTSHTICFCFYDSHALADTRLSYRSRKRRRTACAQQDPRILPRVRNTTTATQMLGFRTSIKKKKKYRNADSYTILLCAHADGSVMILLFTRPAAGARATAIIIRLAGLLAHAADENMSLGPFLDE